MNQDGSGRPRTATREERLAAKLRENLKRRKAQARALPPAPGLSPGPATEAAEDGLSKEPGGS